MDYKEAGVPRIPESLLSRGRGGGRLAEGARRYERRQHHPSSSRHMKKIVVRAGVGQTRPARGPFRGFHDRKSTRLNSSHSQISYAVFCLKKKKKHNTSSRYSTKSFMLSNSLKI